MKRSLALGVGVMMGIFPVWGFQMLVAAFLAYIFKLNKIIVLAASNISLPPMIPFIIYLSYLIGGLFVSTGIDIKSLDDMTFNSINLNFFQYFIGAIVLSVIMGFIAFISSLLILKVFSKSK